MIEPSVLTRRLKLTLAHSGKDVRSIAFSYATGTRFPVNQCLHLLVEGPPGFRNSNASDRLSLDGVSFGSEGNNIVS